jgi:phage-related protein
VAAVIIFNGAALEDVAPVMIEDIRVSPIQLSATARERPINWGSDFVRLVGGDRTVAITFALLTRDIGERQEQLRQITRWARTDRPGKLHLSWREGYYLECLCTGLPEPSTRQWWESKLRLTFTTFDNPFWTSDAEKTAAEMEARLADPETYRNPEEGAKLTQEYHRMKERIDALYERWEQEDM